MNCTEVQTKLAQGSKEGSSELACHLEGCEACQAFAHVHPALSQADAGPPEQLDSSWSELQRELSHETPLDRTRSLRTTTRVLLVLALAFVLALVQLLWRRRPDFSVYPLGILLTTVASYALVFGFGARLSLYPLHRRAPSTRYTGSVLAVALGLPLLFAVLGGDSAHPEGSPFWYSLASCFAYGTGMGLSVLVAFRLLDRNAHRSGLAAVHAAAAAGIAGNLALALHCPIEHVAHLVLGHGLIGFCLLGAYALFRRTLSPPYGRHPSR